MSMVSIEANDSTPNPKQENKEGKVRNVWVPIFKESQVNKELDENDQPTGETIPFLEVLQTNMSAAMDASMSAFGDDDTLIFFCIAQKDGDEHKIGIIGTSINQDDVEEFVINIPKLPIKHKFTVVGKKE